MTAVTRSPYPCIAIHPRQCAQLKESIHLFISTKCLPLRNCLLAAVLRSTSSVAWYSRLAPNSRAPPHISVHSHTSLRFSLHDCREASRTVRRLAALLRDTRELSPAVAGRRCCICRVFGARPEPTVAEGGQAACWLVSMTATSRRGSSASTWAANPSPLPGRR